MFEWLSWFTDMQNTKPFALVLFFTCFIGIIAYVYLGKKRSKRFEDYRYIPLMDEDDADHKEFRQEK
jgi:cbb3-type cytochrome oxidase subunit 3